MQRERRNGVNEQQRRFCEEYIIDRNATQAAIRAGYAVASARQQGSRLMTHDDVRQKIAEMSESIQRSDTIATAGEVLAHFTAVMRGEVFDQIVRRDDDGNLIKIDVTAKLADRNRAAEALAKHYALLVDKVEMTRPKTELAEMIEEALHG